MRSKNGIDKNRPIDVPSEGSGFSNKPLRQVVDRAVPNALGISFQVVDRRRWLPVQTACRDFSHSRS